MPDPTSLLEIGARLAVTRKVLGLTQADMDRRMGSALTNGQTGTGRQRIPTHHGAARASILEMAERGDRASSGDKESGRGRKPPSRPTAASVRVAVILQKTAAASQPSPRVVSWISYAFVV